MTPVWIARLRRCARSRPESPPQSQPSPAFFLPWGAGSQGTSSPATPWSAASQDGNARSGTWDPRGLPWACATTTVPVRPYPGIERTRQGLQRPRPWISRPNPGRERPTPWIFRPKPDPRRPRPGARRHNLIGSVRTCVLAVPDRSAGRTTFGRSARRHRFCRNTLGAVVPILGRSDCALGRSDFTFGFRAEDLGRGGCNHGFRADALGHSKLCRGFRAPGCGPGEFNSGCPGRVLGCMARRIECSLEACAALSGAWDSCWQSRGARSPSPAGRKASVGTHHVAGRCSTLGSAISLPGSARPDISWPACAGSFHIVHAEVALIAATIAKAGPKFPAAVGLL
jgi:hypothetical protein